MSTRNNSKKTLQEMDYVSRLSTSKRSLPSGLKKQTSQSKGCYSSWKHSISSGGQEPGKPHADLLLWQLHPQDLLPRISSLLFVSFQTWPNTPSQRLPQNSGRIRPLRVAPMATERPSALCAALAHLLAGLPPNDGSMETSTLFCYHSFTQAFTHSSEYSLPAEHRGYKELSRLHLLFFQLFIVPSTLLIFISPVLLTCAI